MISVAVSGLAKSYDKGRVQALSGISFEVEEGEIFGVIGPDGAGKTTLFRILTTLLLPTSGSATLDGLEVVRDFKVIRHRVGYMPGRFSLYQDLSVEENLSFFATVFNSSIEANYDLIRDIYVQIEPFKKRRAGQLSGGMKQKLALSCALIHRPTVLILDEPTTGVDAVSRKEFWEMLRRLKAKGITILVSTPYMDEAILCDRVALIQAGRFLKIAPPHTITEGFGKPLFAVKADRMFDLLHDLRSMPVATKVYPFGEYHHLILSQPGISVGQVSNFLTEKGHIRTSVRSIEPTIEDVFIDLMQTD